MPIVSVVVPVYNMALYVAQSIESVLRQTFLDLELIIVNDGSTDNSLDIINAYAKRDKRIRVINKPNAGLASAYNSGQQVAEGKYIYFLDSDDWMERDCLQTLCSVAEQTGADVVKAAGILIDRNGKTIAQMMIPGNKCNRLITNMLSIPEFVSNHVAQWTCLYRRDFLWNNNIWCPEYPKQIAPDIDFMYHVWVKCKRLFVVPRGFIHYRLDNANSDKNSGSKMSFYLLRGHLVARATMAKLRLNKSYWYVKTKVEFNHFLYELQAGRCCTNRWTYIHGVAKIFQENLRHKLVDFAHWSLPQITTYKIIAHTPWLYWFSTTTHVWSTTTKRQSSDKIYSRLFGLYKKIQNASNEKIYFCGLPIKKRKRKKNV